MFTIIVFFIVLSILVIIHELGHFLIAKANGIRVDEFGFGLPPRVFGVKFGETLYSLNLLPFGGFVKVLGEEEEELTGKKLPKKELERAFSRKKPWQKAMVLVAGVTFNFLLGWIIISYLFTQGVPVPSEIVHVEEVVAGSPADERGLVSGDIIEKITHETGVILVDETSDVSQATQDFAGKTVTLSVRRGNTLSDIDIIPRENPPAGEGSLGITITNYTLKKYSAIEAPFIGLYESARMTGIIFKELSKTLFRFVTFQEQQADVAGPVGIARLTSDAARQGTSALLQLIGLLSLNLAVINILPFPALDGGRLVFVIYEWVTKKTINPIMEKRLNIVGFAFLLSLIVLVTINDIIKLLNG